MNTTTGVEHFGVRHEQNILITTPSGEKVPAAVCSLAVDGTFDEIFSRFRHPRHKVAFSPETVEAFHGEHQGVLLEQDHATMILRQVAPDGYDIVCLEMDEHWKLEKMVLTLDHTHVWRANDWHQVVVPTHLFS